MLVLHPIFYNLLSYFQNWNHHFLPMHCCPALELPEQVAVLERLAVLLVPAGLGLSESLRCWMKSCYLKRFHYRSLYLLSWLPSLKLIPVPEFLQLAVELVL